VKVAHPNEKVTVSLGVAAMEVESMKPVPELIHEADVALYRSKSLGKNRVTCYCNTLTMPGMKADQSSASAPDTP
jgi:PleD family two-component response regulator